MTAPKPWVPEYAVSVQVARHLCCEQFTASFAADVAVTPFGQGWDNRAFLMIDRAGFEWVLRFPQRAVAAPLMARELELLPRLSAKLASSDATPADAGLDAAVESTLALPNPELQGVAAGDYPYPFGGYRRLPGRTACAWKRGPGAERPGARALGQLLGALHPLGSAAPFVKFFERDLGTGDALAGRLRRFEERLGELEAGSARLGVQPSDIRGAAHEVRTCPPWNGPPQLVHGDLYGRHLLVDEAGHPTAVIDWGDAHRGDPALDLSFAWTYFAGPAREELLAAYERVSGSEVDPATRGRARFRALEYGVTLLHYGSSVGDGPMADLGREALQHVLGAP
ncbi:MAG: phosphotransferase [Planctomycetes bacterium]|nr:phosphotransferase [Planctomycetota bacterium]